eukprot:TRINITY_DN8912_c0_g1_i2.p1 TRINITY_DN8912_c0_g1~~TRINITY_DN8912_c0_g1_i2.p1  ORF type:complete len:129 (+),score=16.02 TRINITY_DN8912_c0_g1_i2:734-1120(+)
MADVCPSEGIRLHAADDRRKQSRSQARRFNTSSTALGKLLCCNILFANAHNVVLFLQAEALARRHQIPHFVITAKDEAQVLSAFKELTTMCLAFRSAEAPSIANCDRQIKWHTPNTQTTYWDSYCTLL